MERLIVCGLGSYLAWAEEPKERWTRTGREERKAWHLPLRKAKMEKNKAR
ncbi:MAG: hypothetical protein LBU47_06275 [Christensenellaceae bacterium]|jgi:hypothetical protein|nr:hypothetical protein [Christensenellaceae bacterium]